MKRYIFLLLLALQTNCVIAQDTSSVETPPTKQFRIRSLYIPTGLLLAGVALNGNGSESLKKEIAEERNEHLLKFRVGIDNYLQITPIFVVYGLDAAGVKAKTEIINRSVILFKGELLMLSSVAILKEVTHQLRPDVSNYLSFPSGHTAQAFAAATFLSEEYKKRYKWMPYAAYGVASSVGVLRMANNKHYISDVLFGAGFGILSMKAAYWTHQYKWNKKHFVVNPIKSKLG